MATGLEQTLELKNFEGISRYYNSTLEPTTKFYTAQNMYSPTKGELALLGGVTDKSGTGLPGVTAIKSLHFLKTAIGYDRALVFFDHNTIPTPSGFTPAFTGTGSSGSYSAGAFKISYVGLGGESLLASSASFSGSGSAVRITIPTLPAGIVGINVYLAASTIDYLIATVSQRDGVMASYIDIPVSFLNAIPVEAETYQPVGATIPALYNEKRITVTDFEVAFSNEPSGRLEAGRTYYFGIAPFYKTPGVGTFPVVTTFTGQNSLPNRVTPSKKVFSFTVPEGMNSAVIRLTNAQAEMRLWLYGEDVTNIKNWYPVDTGTYGDPYVWLLLGTTPEDLIAVGEGVDGIAFPRLATDLAYPVMELPYNSNLASYKSIVGRAMDQNTVDYADALNMNALRISVMASFVDYESAGGLNTARYKPIGNTGLGCWALPEASYNATTAYQIIPARGAVHYSKNTVVQGGIREESEDTGYVPVGVFMPFSGGQFIVEQGQGLSSSVYINRIYFANGVQCPFYTNGYVLKPVERKMSTPFLPITNEITVFKDRLILGGGLSSLYNTQNVVYYSAAADFGTFTASPSGTAGLQFISAIEADSDEIVGFGVYSESVNQYGNQGFLVIGKSLKVYTWNGDTSQGAQPVNSKGGFASRKSFGVLPIGPVFVSRENVHHLSSGTKSQKIGNAIEAIIRSLTDTQLATINVVVHEDNLKIGYRDTANIDREVWLNIVETEEGTMLPQFTGPHIMKAYDGQAAVDSFAGERDVRLSFLGTKIYRRDDYTSYLNDGVDITPLLETNDMAMGTDEFGKLLTRFYVRSKVKKAETLTLTIKMHDNKQAGQGSDYTLDPDTTFSESMTLPYTGPGTTYRLFQKQFATRYRGSLLRFTLSLSTNEDFRIQSMRWLFQMSRRRLL